VASHAAGLPSRQAREANLAARPRLGCLVLYAD